MAENSTASPRHYDLCVIGAGPGGYVAAIRAAQLGMRVAIVEKNAELGGTCLNVGCIPSKALLESSEAYAHARSGLAAHGIRTSGVELDLPALMKRKQRVVTTLTRGVAGLMKKNAIETIRGVARIATPGRIEVGGEEPCEVEAERTLIATGSVPAELAALPFDGRRIVSSTEALSFDPVPERLLVVGGGAIGLELGSVWSRLGARVTVVELLDQLAPGTDADIARALHRSLTRQGLAIRLATGAVGTETRGDGLRVTLESVAPHAETSGAGNHEDAGESHEEDFDVVLVAVGRRPSTEGLGLDEVGIATDGRGRIVVGDDYETSVAGVYAIGDVIAGPMLAHKAEEEGVACVERMKGLTAQVCYEAIPSIIYTWPEVASVGLGEARAREAGHDVRTGACPFQANARARCMDRREGFVKVVADGRTDELLGVHIFGPSASELIAEAAVAIELSASAEDLGRSVHAHPTLSECLKEAALAASGRAIHL